MGVLTMRSLARDRVRGVAGGYQPGLCLWGVSGDAAVRMVQSELTDLDCRHNVTASPLKTMELFERLSAEPDAVHILDDAGAVLANKNSLVLLRSAMETVGARAVKWHSKKGWREFVFTGGIILVARCQLGDLPAYTTLASRIPFVRYR